MSKTGISYLEDLLRYQYRISRNSGRGSYHFVGQILPQNWVSAVLILGAVIIYLEQNQNKMLGKFYYQVSSR